MTEAGEVDLDRHQKSFVSRILSMVSCALDQVHRDFDKEERS